jgi:hypothetical protein
MLDTYNIGDTPMSSSTGKKGKGKDSVLKPPKPLKPSKTVKPQEKNWMEKILDELGIEMHRVEAPKDFCRVIFPQDQEPKQDPKDK